MTGTPCPSARAYLRLTEEYAAPLAPGRDRGERRFGRLIAGSLAACLALGYAALGVEVPAPVESLRGAARRATFVLEPAARKAAPPATPRALETPPPERAPQDLTQNPLLGQAEPRAAQEALARAQAQPAEADPRGESEERREVYGLRRVYARGLGTGAAGGALLTKRGNTLAKQPDSLTARPEDLPTAPANLSAELVPLSHVTRAPELVHRVVPAYTPDMVAHRVEGTVKARLLVDADGAVKAVEMIDDLGHGSRETARAAFRELRFRPALQGEQPVAAWIVMKYRFVLQE